MKVRINKYLANAGVAARRKCDELIAKGTVTVNGVTATNGQKVETDTDVVKLSGEIVNSSEKFLYIMLNKPAGYITANTDDRGRQTVIDLLDEKLKRKRVYPVGRLDYDSRGLVLLTNDGQLAHRIIHPKHHIEKEYVVTVSGTPDAEKIAQLRTGVFIGDYTTQPARVKQESTNQLRVTLTEGKHRQIRRMCVAVGLFVKDLQRVRIGIIKLGGLKEGCFTDIPADQMQELIATVR